MMKEKKPAAEKDIDKIMQTESTRDVAKQKKLEKELIHERNLLRNLLDNIPDSIYFKDKEHKFVAVSKAKAEHHGLSSEDFVGKTDFDFFPEECARKMHEANDQVLKTGKSIVGREEKVTHPDGSVHWYSVTKVPYQDKDGNIIGTMGISRDITERERAEEKLKVEKEFSDHLFESSESCLILVNGKKEIVRVNDAALKIFGRKKEEVLGRICHEFICPAEKGKCPIFDLGEEVDYSERVVLNSKGEKVPVIKTVGKIEKEGKTYLLESFMDLTDRKRVEKELAQERDLLHVLMDNIPDAIYFKDTASRFTRINKAEAHLLGVKDPEEVVGKTDFDYFAEEHARDAFADEQKIMKIEQALISKVEKSERPDGYFVWHSTTKVPIKDKEGRVIGTVGISRDITERKQLEEELKQASAAIAEISLKKDEEIKRLKQRIAELEKK